MESDKDSGDQKVKDEMGWMPERRNLSCKEYWNISFKEDYQKILQQEMSNINCKEDTVTGMEESQL